MSKLGIPVIQAAADVANNPYLREQDDAEVIKAFVAFNPDVVQAIDEYKSRKNSIDSQNNRTPIPTAADIIAAQEEDKRPIIKEDTKQIEEIEQEKISDDELER